MMITLLRWILSNLAASKTYFVPDTPLQEASLGSLGLRLKMAAWHFSNARNYKQAEAEMDAVMDELMRRDQERIVLMHWREERDRYLQFYWDALRELRAAHAWRGDLVWMRREDMFDA